MNGIASARFIVGDVFKAMADMPDGSVDLIMTSPPFLALRSYLPADHPDKDLEIGSESTPAEFIDTLLRLTAEWRRLLAPHGSLVVELGDTYSGGWVGTSTPVDERLNADGGPRIQDQRRTSHAKRNKLRESNLRGWSLPKSLALVPEAYRFALAYGTNPHTGVPSPAGRWRVRNVIRWVRPNPPVGALGDKFRPATSELVVACVSDKRWFDLDAVRTPYKTDGGTEWNSTDGPNPNRADRGANNFAHGSFGAPPLDWWKISPTGYSGSHYAVYPGELCVTPIKSMCPQRVCRTCGQPSRWIAETSYVDAKGNQIEGESWPSGMLDGNRGAHSHKSVTATRVDSTVSWTDCGHDDWRRGVVLDPFAGTGTTLMVATGLDRDAIGIDLDQRNLALAEQRIGMFLTQEAT